VRVRVLWRESALLCPDFFGDGASVGVEPLPLSFAESLLRRGRLASVFVSRGFSGILAFDLVLDLDLVLALERDRRLSMLFLPSPALLLAVLGGVGLRSSRLSIPSSSTSQRPVSVRMPTSSVVLGLRNTICAACIESRIGKDASSALSLAAIALLSSSSGLAGGGGSGLFGR